MIIAKIMKESWIFSIILFLDNCVADITSPIAEYKMDLNDNSGDFNSMMTNGTRYAFFRSMDDSFRAGSRRVFGGAAAAARLAQFPAACALLDRARAVRCSASVLAPRWALTAAHCVAPRLAYVAYNTRTPSAGGQLARVALLYRHPHYKVEQTDDGRGPDVTTLHHDVGLVRTRDDMRLASAQRPLLQRLPDVEHAYNAEVLVLGFGRTERTALGEQLFAVRLRLARCERGDAWLHCVCGVGDEPSGVCSGDSGGPVLYRGELVGVTSMGPVACARGAAGASSVFTTLRRYAGLINATVHDAEHALRMLGKVMIVDRAQVGVTSMGPVACARGAAGASSVFTTLRRYAGLINATVHDAEHALRMLGKVMIVDRAQVGVTSMGPVACARGAAGASSVFTTLRRYAGLINATVHDAEHALRMLGKVMIVDRAQVGVTSMGPVACARGAAGASSVFTTLRRYAGLINATVHDAEHALRMLGKVMIVDRAQVGVTSMGPVACARGAAGASSVFTTLRRYAGLINATVHDAEHALRMLGKVMIVDRAQVGVTSMGPVACARGAAGASSVFTTLRRYAGLINATVHDAEHALRMPCKVMIVDRAQVGVTSMGPVACARSAAGASSVFTTLRRYAGLINATVHDAEHALRMLGKVMIVDRAQVGVTSMGPVACARGAAGASSVFTTLRRYAGLINATVHDAEHALRMLGKVMIVDRAQVGVTSMGPVACARGAAGASSVFTTLRRYAGLINATVHDAEHALRMRPVARAAPLVATLTATRALCSFIWLLWKFVL